MGHQLHFFSPYKTFLLGEYAVLETGRAILLATQPGFSMTLTTSATDYSWNALSLALRLNKNCPITAIWYDAFARHPMQVDVVRGWKKGFGASGALSWWALVYAYWSEHSRLPDMDIDYLATCMQYVRQLWAEQPGRSQSGADMLSQFGGQLLCTHPDEYHTASAWPFPGLGLILFATGSRLDTHLHIQEVQFDVSKFATLVTDAELACQRGDQTSFTEIFTQYQNALVGQRLQCEQTTQWVRRLHDCPGFVAAKGCGAYGAEVICLLYDYKQQDACLAFASSLPMAVVATEQDICSGLSVQALSAPIDG